MSPAATTTNTTNVTPDPVLVDAVDAYVLLASHGLSANRGSKDEKESEKEEKKEESDFRLSPSVGTWFTGEVSLPLRASRLT